MANPAEIGEGTIPEELSGVAAPPQPAAQPIIQVGSGSFSNLGTAPIIQAIDQLPESEQMVTVQERARKLACDVVEYIPHVLDNAPAKSTLLDLNHAILFGNLQNDASRLETLKSMLDPICLWDPLGCLRHRPVFQFIRRALELYNIEYAPPRPRADSRFSALLRKDVRVRVAYSLYQDEHELGEDLEGIFTIQAVFESRTYGAKHSGRSPERSLSQQRPDQALGDESSVQDTKSPKRFRNDFANIVHPTSQTTRYRRPTSERIEVQHEMGEQTTSVAPGQPVGDAGSGSDHSDHNGRSGPGRDNGPHFPIRTQAEQESSDPPDTASSVGRNSVAEDAIVELRTLFQEQWQRDASEKDDQKRTRADAARQKASQAISGAFRDRMFTSSLGQNLLEYIERFEAVCESNAIALEFKASLIHYMLSDSPLRAYNVTIKPYKNSYSERMDALKALFLSPDAAQRALQQRDSLKLADMLPTGISPWDQETHREYFSKLTDQIQDLTTRCPPGFNEPVHATQCLRVALERYDWQRARSVD
jgi:hypothetical protein